MTMGISSVFKDYVEQKLKTCALVSHGNKASWLYYVDQGRSIQFKVAQDLAIDALLFFEEEDN